MADVPEVSPEDDQEDDIEVDDQEEVLEEDQSQESEETSLLDNFTTGKPMLAPMELQLEFWSRAIQHDPAYGKNAWRTLNMSSTLRKYTQHPEAVAFRVPEPDPGLEPLGFDDKIELEGNMVTLMKLAGGIGAVGSRLLALFDAKVQALSLTIKDYRDPAVAIENPREEAAAIITTLKQTLAVTWAKELTDLTKFAGASYNKMLQMRR